MIEISANGASITPMMGVKALRQGGNHATFVAVGKFQWCEIADLYKTVKVVNPESLRDLFSKGMTFMALPVRLDESVPDTEIDFRGEDNVTVAKITGLGRSRAIPIEELKRG